MFSARRSSAAELADGPQRLRRRPVRLIEIADLVDDWRMRGVDARHPAAHALGIVVLVGLVRQVDRYVLRRIAEGEHRVLALLDLLDLTAQHAAEQRDAVVRGAE